MTWSPKKYLAEKSREVGYRRFWAAIATNFLLVAVVLGCVWNASSSRSSARPEQAQPPVTGSANWKLCDEGSTVGAANQIIENRAVADYPVARRVYEETLRRRPTDSCAVQGLALLTGLEAEASKPKTWYGSWAESWADYVKRVLTPAGTLLGAAAAVFLVLLVGARLATTLVVRPTTVSPRYGRPLAYGAGIAMLALASALPVVVTYAPFNGEPKPFGDRSVPWLEILVVILALCGIAALFRNPSKARWEGSIWRPVIGTFVGLGTVVVALRASQGIADTAVAFWWVAGGLALTGLGWVAYGRGTRLAAEITVQKDDTAKESLNRLLLARLAQLGSTPPRGIRIPPASDVTSLPDDALTSVPEGAAAATIFKVLRLVRPSTPWQFRVAISGNDLVIISLSRNRVACGGAETLISRTELLPAVKEAPEKEDATRSVDAFLTAAAAHLLIELSRVHPELTIGLCGAEHWQGIAFQSLARNAVHGSAQRTELLERALESDPNYGLAQLAYVYTMPRTDSKERRTLAEAMYRLGTRSEFKTTNKYLDPDVSPKKEVIPQLGWQALHFRVLYGIAATSLNTALLAAHPRPYWIQSARAALELTWRLRFLRDKEMERLAGQLQTPLYFLLCDLKTMRPNIALTPPDERYSTNLVTQLAAVQAEWGTPATRLDRYAFAAHLAADRPAAEFLTEIQRVISRPELRESIWDDPSFARFLAEPTTVDAESRRQFKKIVGVETLASFHDLSPFKPWAESLKAAGFLDLDDLATAPERQLARRFRVSPQRVRRWRALAELAVAALEEPSCAHPSTSLEILWLLVEIGITSTGDLRDEMQADRSGVTPLYSRLVAAAKRSTVVPERSETVDSNRWQRIASAGDGHHGARRPNGPR